MGGNRLSIHPLFNLGQRQEGVYPWALGLRTPNARTGLPGSWNTWALHHPDPSTATHGPAHRLCLLGEPLGDPLAGEPLGDPFPWEPLLSPLNMVVKQVPAQAGLSWTEGGKATRPRWLLAGLWRGGAAVGRGWQFLGGPSLQVWCPGQARPAHAPAPAPTCTASSCTTSLGGEGTTQGRGARATPTEVWTCYTHTPS